MLGNILLYISFAFFSAAFLGLLLKELQNLLKIKLPSNIKYSNEHIKLLIRIAISSIAAASILLFYQLLTSDFSIYYVWQYTSLDLPLIYKISAFWTGKSGAYLFLTCVIFGTSAWLSEKHGFETSWHRKNQIIILVVGLFFLYMTIRHTPFTSIFDAFPNSTTIPNDGIGMDPILINFWMALHPPGIFLGYGLLTLTFSTALLSPIKQNDSEQYSLSAGRLAWAALGAGIVSGCLWSYEVWDGFWIWDPAFTSSLMVWLLLTAFLHSSIRPKTKPIFKKQTRALGAFTFIIAIYSIYIIHSGDIQSVHAFEEGAQSKLLLYTAIISCIPILYILFKNDKQKQTSTITKTKTNDTERTKPFISELLSHQNLFTITLLLLVALTLIILWGLSFPLVMQIFGIKTVISNAIYNDWSYPITLLLLAVLGICVNNQNIRSRSLTLIITIAASGTILFLIIAPFENIHTNISTPILAFATISSLIAVIKGTRKKQIKTTSAHIIHFGITLILIGVLMSNYTISETVLFQSIDDTKSIGYYEIQLNDIIAPPTKINEPILGSTKTATYSIYKNGKTIGKGSATFEEQKGEYITHVYTHHSILSDIRISYQGIGTTDPIFISVANVKVIPGMSILWSGCALVIFGILPIVLRRKKE